MSKKSLHTMGDRYIVQDIDDYISHGTDGRLTAPTQIDQDGHLPLCVMNTEKRPAAYVSGGVR